MPRAFRLDQAEAASNLQEAASRGARPCGARAERPQGVSDRWSRCPGCWHRLHRATPRHGDRADGPPGRRTRRARSSRGLRGAHRFLRLRSMRSVRSGGSGVHSLAGSCQTASRGVLTAERPDSGGSPASGRSFTIRVRGPVAFSGPPKGRCRGRTGGAGPSHRPGPALRRARGSPPERSFRGTSDSSHRPLPASALPPGCGSNLPCAPAAPSRPCARDRLAGRGQRYCWARGAHPILEPLPPSADVTAAYGPWPRRE